MQNFINRRTQTILQGFAKRGSYTLPNGSIVTSIEAMGNGPCQPVTRMLTLDDGSIIKAQDGSCVRFILDPQTNRYKHI